MTPIEFVVPVKLESEANSHTHWRIRARRAKAQRLAVWAVGRPLMPVGVVSLPVTVTITRVAARELDSDNLVGSAKHVRDEVAKLLGVDDRDKRVTWVVEQEKGPPKTYGCRVRIEARP